MSAKVRIFAVILLLTSLLAGVAPMASAGGPWYVSTTGDDGNDCLSWATACRTIQGAVNKADPGDTIYVAAGTYAGNITITKSVTLIGDPGDASPGPGPNAPVIDGGSVPGSAFFIENGVSGVTIQGFEMCHFTSNDNGIGNGISAWEASTSNVTIQDNYFHDLGWNGVLVGNDGAKGDHTNWTIKGNILEDYDYYGFELTNASNSTFEDNVIHASDSVTAILVVARRNESGITVRNNQIDGSILSGTDGRAAIYVLAWDQEITNPTLTSLLIEGNEISTTGDRPHILIYEAGGTITGAQLHGNSFKTLRSLTAGMVDATRNWWGDVDPSDNIIPGSGPVDYSPWWGADYVGDPHTTPWTWYTNDSIQDAVDVASAGDTIHVAAGTYVEQVEIAKNLTLQGVGSGTVIQSPDVLTKKFTTSADNKPVVYIHNADAVTLKDLVVDGAGKGNANYRFVGVAFYNAGGTVDTVEIKDVRDTPWSGAQHGVALYAFNADSAPRTLTVTDCNIHDFQKNGTSLNGAGLTVSVTGNTVTGYGPTTVTAQNGIQVSYGASGTVSGNTVSDVSWLGATWTASAILVMYAGDVDVANNTVSEGQTGIYFWDASGDISSNTVTASDTGIGREDFYGIIAGDPPMVLPSPFGDGVLGAAEVRAMAELTINVTNNTLTGSGSDLSEGLEIPAGYEDDNVSVTATGNTITGWGYGVTVYKCTSDCGTGDFTSLEIHQNSIYGNTEYGMYVDGMTSDVDAELNYWGDTTGPYHSTNPNGKGNAVSDYVDFSPWLGATPGSSPMTYGVIPGDSIGDAIALMEPGDTLILMAGNHPGGITIAKGITLRGEPGAVIGPGSDGITVTANDVTIMDVTLDGTGGDPGNVGIRVADGVQRLHVEGCEILNWPDDGIHFNGAITGLKVVDNYIHDNGGDGMEFNGTPAGTVQIYGNAFRANTGSGINAVSGSVVAEYNEWGDIAGPAGTNGDGVSGSVDADPWVFGAVYADVVPDPARVREGENVDVDIKVDTANLYGAQFSLTFDPAKLKVQSVVDEGAGYFKGSQACNTTYNNTTGTLTFYCSRGGTDAAVSGTGVKLLTITFQAQEIVGTDTTATIDVDATSVRLGAVGGVNIYVDSVTDDTLTIYGTTDVSGVVDLQGRSNDAGAVVTFPAGILYAGGTDTTDSWGRYDFAGVTDGSYLVTIEMARYLDASATVNVAGDTLVLNPVVLLGGDADDSDTIDVSDLTIIGGQFGKSGSGITDTRADINNDGVVDILDIVLAAGNYDQSSPVSWTPQ